MAHILKPLDLELWKSEPVGNEDTLAKEYQQFCGYVSVCLQSISRTKEFFPNQYEFACLVTVGRIESNAFMLSTSKRVIFIDQLYYCFILAFELSIPKKNSDKVLSLLRKTGSFGHMSSFSYYNGRQWISRLLNSMK